MPECAAVSAIFRAASRPSSHTACSRAVGSNGQRLPSAGARKLRVVREPRRSKRPAAVGGARHANDVAARLLRSRISLGPDDRESTSCARAGKHDPRRLFVRRARVAVNVVDAPRRRERRTAIVADREVEIGARRPSSPSRSRRPFGPVPSATAWSSRPRAPPASAALTGRAPRVDCAPMLPGAFRLRAIPSEDQRASTLRAHCRSLRLDGLLLTFTNNNRETGNDHRTGKELGERERTGNPCIHANELDGESQRAGENKVTREHFGI